MKLQLKKSVIKYLWIGLFGLLSATVGRADKIAAGKDFAGAIDAGGILRTWGNNASGQLGHSSGTTVVAMPTKVSATDTYDAIAMGGDFTLAIDKSGVVWAWGSNALGQLGYGSSITAATSRVKVALPAGTSAKAIAAGLSHGIALLSDGRVYTWGSSSLGQLGHNEGAFTSKIYTPLPVYDGIGTTTSNWRYSGIGASDLSTFLIKTDGTLWACGNNTRGELGVGSSSISYRSNLDQVGTLAGWTQVKGSALYAWGDNGEGQMGNGTYNNTSMSPTPLATDKTWAAIGTGRNSFSSYAITTTGALYAWGGNLSGQLNLPVSLSPLSAGYIKTPTLLSAVPAGWTSPWVGCAAGSNFALFSDSGNPQLVYSVGDNAYGQLANGLVDSTLNQTPSFVSTKISLNDIKVAAPVLANTTLGANTTISSLSLTVTNNNSANIVAGSVVRLYLSANSNLYPNSDGVVDASASLLGSTTISSLAGSAVTTATLTNLSLPDAQGVFYLIADVSLPNGTADADTSNNTLFTQVTLQRPKLALGNLQGLANSTSIDVPSPFTGVQFDLTNIDKGMVPVGSVVTYEVYLYSGSDLTAFDPLNIPSSVIQVATGTYSAGLSYQSTSTIGPLTINIPSTVVAGDYYMIFLANRNRNINENDSLIAQLAQKVTLTSTAAPGPALNYGNYSMSSSPANKQWIRVTDVIASGKEAWQTPKLLQGESATLSLTVTGPTTINAPWLIVGSASPLDQIVCKLDGGTQATRSGYQPSYNPNIITIPAGTHTVSWTYTQNSLVVLNVTNLTYARLDLDLPSFSTQSTLGAGTWLAYTDATAPTPDGKVAKSPALLQGQYAALATKVVGPAVVKFWWKADSVASVAASGLTPATTGDTLTFAIDGSQANLITTTYAATAAAAVISGHTGWQQVAFLIPGGFHDLSWTFNQNTNTTTPISVVYVDGLEVLSPMPTSITPNFTTSAVTYPGVPKNTVDLSVGQVVATPSTYILDDANGTGRLPVTITMVNLGSAYTPAAAVSATNLDIRLSKTGVFDAADNIHLGDFAKIGISSTGTPNTLANGAAVVFDAELNLPFDIPTDDYYLMVRCTTGQLESANPEFTLANNTWVSSTNGFRIKRLPDLQVANQQGLSSAYPYHPEDPLYIKYDIVNKGLGDVLVSQLFQVQVRLRAYKLGSPLDIGNDVIVKTYPPIYQSQFLPAAGPQYPTGGVLNITHYLDLPSLRDMLAALGIVATTDTEDSAIVVSHSGDLRKFGYYFDVFVDSTNLVPESSETNLFLCGGTFSVVPVVSMQGFGDVVGDPVTGSIYTNNSNPFVAGTFDGTALGGGTANDLNFSKIVQDYALGQSSAGSPGLLYDFSQQNGQPSVVVPPNLSDNYLALTFDFNVRAYDVQLLVQCSPDLASWTTIKTVTPPYYGTSGPQALTGYLSLKDDPYVLSVDGNSTDVQKVYIARVTVRDQVPLSSGSRFMRLVVQAKPGIIAPVAPTIVTPVYLNSADPLVSSGVILSWNATLSTIANPFNSSGTIVAGSYIIERSVTGATGTFKTLATLSDAVTYTDTLVASASTYWYRIRAINAAGSSVYSNVVSQGVP